MERKDGIRVEHLTFAGLDQRMAHGWPPPGGLTDNDMNNVVQTVIRAAGAVDDVAIKARSNPSLSPAGRREQITPYHAAAKAKAADAAQRIARERQRIAADHAKLFEVPQLDGADAVNATLDAEIRARVGALTGRPRDTLYDGLRAGKEDRVLYALLRDPLATPDRESARALWSEHVKATRRDEIAKLDTAGENVNWAAGSVAALQHVLDAVKGPELT